MIPGILLAAGLSRRFGAQKLLTRLPTGLSVFDHALRNHLEADVLPLVVVVSHGLLSVVIKEEGALRIEKKNSKGVSWGTTPWGEVRLVLNEIPEAGMSKSLKLGLAGLTEAEKERGVLISLADMPKITPEIIGALVRMYRQGKGKVVVPTYEGRIGHPVIIHEPALRDEINKIAGDKGLRDIIKTRSGGVVCVPWKDAAVVTDIDTPSDLEKMFREGG